MNHGLRAALDQVRERYATQVRLQQRYLERHDVTGAAALEASRQLRWHGSELVGDLLPTRDR